MDDLFSRWFGIRIECIDDPRHARWVTSFYDLDKVEPFLIPIAQFLGRIDVKLKLADQDYTKRRISGKTSFAESSSDFGERYTISCLWVLGAYELIRTTDQCCRDQQGLLDLALTGKVNSTKHLFERLRIPLAKLEPSRRYRDSDSPIDYPAYDIRFGMCWHIAEGVHISRQELSDSLLSLLEAITAVDNDVKTSAM